MQPQQPPAKEAEAPGSSGARVTQAGPESSSRTSSPDPVFKMDEDYEPRVDGTQEPVHSPVGVAAGDISRLCNWFVEIMNKLGSIVKIPKRSKIPSLLEVEVARELDVLAENLKLLTVTKRPGGAPMDQRHSYECREAMEEAFRKCREELEIRAAENDSPDGFVAYFKSICSIAGRVDLIPEITGKTTSVAATLDKSRTDA